MFRIAPLGCHALVPIQVAHPVDTSHQLGLSNLEALLSLVTNDVKMDASEGNPYK